MARPGRRTYAEHIQRILKIPIKDYRSEVAGRFDPTRFDADAWVRQARDAGMKYLVITAKHHDGFAMWPSKVNDYNVMDATPWHHDPMRDLKAACDKYGLQFGFYYSQAFDWGSADGPGNDWDYNNPGGDKHIGGNDWWTAMPAFRTSARHYVDTKALPQLKELIDTYHPALLWFDTPGKLPDDENRRILRFVRETDPSIIVNGRIVWGGGDYDNTADTPVDFPPHAGDWEAIPTTNKSYGWNPHDASHKPPSHFIRLLAKAAARGGNLLLNIGPMGDGAFDPKDAGILQGIGRWWGTYGESIRGTTRTPLAVQTWGQSTRKGNTLYLHVFQWPNDGSLTIGGLKTAVSAARILGQSVSLHAETIGDDVRLTGLPAAAPDADDTVIAVDCDGPPVGDAARLLQTGYASDTLHAFDATLDDHAAPATQNASVTIDDKGGRTNAPAGRLRFASGSAIDDFVRGWVSTSLAVHWPVRVTTAATFSVSVDYVTEDPSDAGGTYAVRVGDQETPRPGDVDARQQMGAARPDRRPRRHHPAARQVRSERDRQNDRRQRTVFAPPRRADAESAMTRHLLIAIVAALGIASSAFAQQAELTVRPDGVSVRDGAGTEMAVVRQGSPRSETVDGVPALAFDGLGDGLTLPATARWTYGQRFTVGLWFRTTAFGRLALVSHYDHAGGWYLHLQNGQLLTVVRQDDRLKASVRSDARFNDGQWHYAAMVWSGRALTQFVDGKAMGHAESPEAFVPPVSSALRIGWFQPWWELHPMDGHLAGLTIEPAALSAEQIEAHVRSASIALHPPATQPVAAWPDASDAPLVAYGVDALVKLAGDAPPPADRSPTVEIEAARGEVEAGQIAVSSLAYTGQVSVHVAPLKRQGGDAPIDVQTRVVGLLPASQNTQIDFRVTTPRPAPTLFPDVLLNTDTVALTPRQTRTAWLTVRVPTEAEPGVYVGDAVVTAGQTTAHVPVRLTVFPARLPGKPVFPLRRLVLCRCGRPIARPVPRPRRPHVLRRLLRPAPDHDRQPERPSRQRLHRRAALEHTLRPDHPVGRRRVHVRFLGVGPVPLRHSGRPRPRRPRDLHRPSGPRGDHPAGPRKCQRPGAAEAHRTRSGRSSVFRRRGDATAGVPAPPRLGRPRVRQNLRRAAARRLGRLRAAGESPQATRAATALGRDAGEPARRQGRRPAARHVLPRSGAV